MQMIQKRWGETSSRNGFARSSWRDDAGGREGLWCESANGPSVGARAGSSHWSRHNFKPQAIHGQMRMPRAITSISAGVPFAASLNSLSISHSRRRFDSEFKEAANVRMRKSLHQTNNDQSLDHRVEQIPMSLIPWSRVPPNQSYFFAAGGTSSIRRSRTSP